MAKRTPAERFWAKVDPSGDCWEWTGSLSGFGYGRFSVDGSGVFVHRFAYELLVGPIPDGLTIDHLCRVRHCVNPLHMEPVSLAENTRRATKGKPGYNSRKIHCKRGHPFDEANTRRRSGGRRECKVCARMLLRRWRAKQAREV